MPETLHTAIDSLARLVDLARAQADDLVNRGGLGTHAQAHARAWRVDLEDLHGQILDYLDNAR